MAADIKVPTLGESVTTATIARWIKKVGEAVLADEPLVELETDKVTVEVNATQAGVLVEIVAPEGAEVEVGGLLGRIGAGDGSVAAPAAAVPAAGVQAPQAAPGPVARPGAALPAAARLIEEKHLSAEGITGTAKDGRISKGDVLEFLNKPAVQQAPPPVKPARTPDVREERVKMTRLRKTIASRLKDAQNSAALLTTFNEVDMSAIIGLRTEYKDAFEKKHKGIRLGFNGFFVKAVTAALQEFPAVNAEIDGDDIVYKHFVHIGIAVGGANGLVVPVIRDADQKSIAQIESEIAGFAKAAKEGTRSWSSSAAVHSPSPTVASTAR
jgi:2-oxoglutarate dehydrogenase E2 component (dihydrolipoamide succinyltransferase)